MCKRITQQRLDQTHHFFFKYFLKSTDGFEGEKNLNNCWEKPKNGTFSNTNVI